MRIALFIVLLHLIFSSSINFTEINISISLPQSILFPYVSTNQKCSQLILRNQSIYRRSNTNLVHTWNRSTLAYAGLFNSYVNSSVQTNISNLQISKDQSEWSFLINKSIIDVYKSSNLSSLLISKDYINEHQNGIFGINYDNSIVTLFTEMTNSQPLEFLTEGIIYISGNVQFTNFIPASNLINQQIVGPNIKLSPNGLIGILWDIYSNFYFFRNDTDTSQVYTYLGSLIFNLTTARSITNTISFSQDSNFAFLQMDSSQPLQIIDLRPIGSNNFTIAGTLAYPGVIKNVLCVEKLNCSIFAILGNANISFYERPTLNFLGTSIIDTDNNAQMSYDEDALFICRYHGFNKFNLNFSCPQGFVFLNNKTCRKVPPNCLNYDLNFTCLTCLMGYDFQNGVCIKVYYSTIIPSPAQATVAENTQAIAQTTTQITSNLFNFLQFSPFTFFFLRVINFFNISSLYIFLNMDLPKYLYIYIYSIYSSLNQSVFQFLGYQVSLPSYSSELVNSDKYLSIGLSTDLFSSNYENAFIFMLVCLIITLLNLAGKNISKTNIFYKLFNLSKLEVISGQFVSLIIGFILPLRFLLQNSYTNSETKINKALSYMIIGFSILFPFIYISLLILSNKQNEKKRSNVKRQSVKVMNIDETDQFYASLINVTFPLLILINQVNLFFVLNFPVLVFGFIKSFFSKTGRVNKIILSFYPLIYHMSFFMIFNYPSRQVKSIFAILSLLALLAGAVHELLTTFVQILKQIYDFCGEKIIKCIIKKNQIFPENVDGQIKQSRIEKIHTKLHIVYKENNEKIKNFEKLSNIMGHRLQIKIKRQKFVNNQDKFLFIQHSKSVCRNQESILSPNIFEQ